MAATGGGTVGRLTTPSWPAATVAVTVVGPAPSGVEAGSVPGAVQAPAAVTVAASRVSRMEDLSLVEDTGSHLPLARQPPGHVVGLWAAAVPVWTPCRAAC